MNVRYPFLTYFPTYFTSPLSTSPASLPYLHPSKKPSATFRLHPLLSLTSPPPSIHPRLPNFALLFPSLPPRNQSARAPPLLPAVRASDRVSRPLHGLAWEPFPCYAGTFFFFFFFYFTSPLSTSPASLPYLHPSKKPSATFRLHPLLSLTSPPPSIHPRLPNFALLFPSLPPRNQSASAPPLLPAVRASDRVSRPLHGLAWEPFPCYAGGRRRGHVPTAARSRSWVLIAGFG